MGSDIYAVAVGEGGAVREVLATDGYTAGSVRLSLDVDLIAYTSSATGRAEVVIRPFPDLASGQAQASTEWRACWA